MKVIIFDKVEICDKSLQRTPEGYLRLQGIIARSGDQLYLKSELGLNDAFHDAQITLQRPIEEVTDPMTVASFMMQPVTDEHPQAGHVDIKNYQRESRGMITDVSATEQNQLKADILVTDESLIRSIEGGKRELSAGYQAKLEFSDDGKTAVQRQIRGNHVAFVTQARCGRECSIFDAAKNPFEKPTETVRMAKIKIKNVEYEIADSAAPVVQNLMTEVDELGKGNKLLSDNASALQAKLDAANDKVTELEGAKLSDADIVSLAQDMAVLWSQVKIIDKDFDCSGKTSDVIRKTIVVAKVGDSMKDKDGAYITARFDVLVDEAKLRDNDPLTASLRDAKDPKKPMGDEELTLEQLAEETEKKRGDKMKRSQNKKVGDVGKLVDK